MVRTGGLSVQTLARSFREWTLHTDSAHARLGSGRILYNCLISAPTNWVEEVVNDDVDGVGDPNLQKQNRQSNSPCRNRLVLGKTLARHGGTGGNLR